MKVAFTPLDKRGMTIAVPILHGLFQVTHFGFSLSSTDTSDGGCQQYSVLRSQEEWSIFSGILIQFNAPT